jgi:hypothetical protein
MTGFLSVVVLQKMNLNSDSEAVAGLHSCNYANPNTVILLAIVPIQKISKNML